MKQLQGLKTLFTIFTFQEFSDWLSSQTFARKISTIQNHHTWLPDYKSWQQKPDALFWMNSMENFQVQEEGFNQTAQNLTTFPDGTIGIGRPIDISPAGISGANKEGICIEHFGNFDADSMADVHRDTILKLNAALCKKFNLLINTDTIVYHHWYDLVTWKRTNGTGQVKTCPGVNFFGGNSVESAEKNFIPLIINSLKTL